METIFIGERLLPGQIGNVFVILSFVFSVGATVAYFMATQQQLDITSRWKKNARFFFLAHAASVIGIVATLFYMLYNHLFEYQYVWQHSNKAMNLKYIFSCFWEGQEGSFLLWSFWHVVLGLILMRSLKNWESPVMTVFSSVQIFLSSMLLGIYIGDFHLGSNPFTILLREHPDFANIPLFANPNYLETLDGRGLNPLLQNYWMTIHPPTLFLGFASTLVPFAFAIAGLWQKKYNQWQSIALPWAFFSIIVLGTGILMGGAWAYEALSFGGFWAWDPVENASLVPWIILVAAAHTMLINKARGTALLSTYILSIATFILILYSTFLTRSGILGETSVHAFTDLGMSGQLLIYLLFYVVLGIVLLLLNRKQLASGKEEDPVLSREFWMFIGALVLIISAFQITYTTSIPVINKIFSLKLAPPSKIVEHYNSWQIPLCILVLLLIGLGQFLKYKNSNAKETAKKLVIPAITSLLLTIAIAFGMQINKPFYALLLFSSLFAAIANADYIRSVLKGNIKKAGASIAHIGFSLIMLGALLSAGKKETISQNSANMSVSNLGEDFSDQKNILLQQHDTLQMGNYHVTYVGKKKEGVNIYFEIKYFTKKDTGYAYEFTLFPLVQTNDRMGNVAEPDTRHFLTKDIYTHITYADLDVIEDDSNSEYAKPKNNIIKMGDTLFTSNSIVLVDSLTADGDKIDTTQQIELAVTAHLRLIDKFSTIYYAKPKYIITNASVKSTDYTVDTLGLKFNFWKINPEKQEVEIYISEKKSNKRDFVVMEAAIFPYINVLWLGCVIMIIGTALAIVERLKKSSSYKI